ncbi:ABC transporter substrate-binding protein [Streptomyces sp. NPDC008092]|uniref:ABC transporter substrate-binding protein n=1 Tax=Streptomyces sp. NPDC008092 TaxID=3364808 RepID=UPI0036EAF73A
MNSPAEQHGTSRSPLIDAAALAAHAGGLPAPRPHTEAELAALIALLTGPKARIETVTIGHSRDDASRAAARAFARAWTARGGQVLTVVDWPETAASWLRPARRLTAETPDAWVIAAAVPGFAQLARRLRRSTGFDPARTVAFSSLHTPSLAALAGPGILSGLRGASADGGIWDVCEECAD